MTQPAAPATGSADAATSARSSSIDTAALDSAVRLFPLLLTLMRGHCSAGIEMPARLLQALRNVTPEIVREYRHALSKERG